MVNEISGLYNVEVKVRETTSLFWRPTADQKKKTTTQVARLLNHGDDHANVSHHLNGDGHFLLQKSTKKILHLIFGSKIGF